VAQRLVGCIVAALCLACMGTQAHAQSYAEIWKNLPWKTNVLTRDACQSRCETSSNDSGNPYSRRCSDMAGTDGEMLRSCLRPHCQQICSYMGTDTSATSSAPPSKSQQTAPRQVPSQQDNERQRKVAECRSEQCEDSPAYAELILACSKANKDGLLTTEGEKACRQSARWWKDDCTKACNASRPIPAVPANLVSGAAGRGQKAPRVLQCQSACQEQTDNARARCPGFDLSKDAAKECQSDTAAWLGTCSGGCTAGKEPDLAALNLITTKHATAPGQPLLPSSPLDARPGTDGPYCISSSMSQSKYRENGIDFIRFDLTLRNDCKSNMQVRIDYANGTSKVETAYANSQRTLPCSTALVGNDPMTSHCRGGYVGVRQID